MEGSLRERKPFLCLEVCFRTPKSATVRTIAFKGLRSSYNTGIFVHETVWQHDDDFEWSCIWLGLGLMNTIGALLNPHFWGGKGYLRGGKGWLRLAIIFLQNATTPQHRGSKDTTAVSNLCVALWDSSVAVWSVEGKTVGPVVICQGIFKFEKKHCHKNRFSFLFVRREICFSMPHRSLGVVRKLWESRLVNSFMRLRWLMKEWLSYPA